MDPQPLQCAPIKSGKDVKKSVFLAKGTVRGKGAFECVSSKFPKIVNDSVSCAKGTVAKDDFDTLYEAVREGLDFEDVDARDSRAEEVFRGKNDFESEGVGLRADSKLDLAR